MRVVAIEQGFDNLCIRNEGDEFDMPDNAFDPRPKKDPVTGKVLEGQFYDPPHWFEPVNSKDKHKVEKLQAAAK